MNIEEEIARIAINVDAPTSQSWLVFQGGENHREYVRRLADALMPLFRRAQAEAGAKALRNLAERTRADFASHKMICGWVGALDDEADRIEQEVEHE